MFTTTLEQSPIGTLPSGRIIAIFENSLPAGFPSPAADYLEGALNIHDFLVQHQAASFFFSVKGDSMIGAHICDGDKVLVDRSVQPKSGHVVVAILNNEYTIKRLFKGSATVELRPENAAYKPIQIKETDEMQVWGVVTGVVRKMAV